MKAMAPGTHSLPAGEAAGLVEALGSAGSADLVAAALAAPEPG